ADAFQNALNSVWEKGATSTIQNYIE
ncbi:hypothetical protein C8N36_1131, partial [Pelagimonas varians]